MERTLTARELARFIGQIVQVDASQYQGELGVLEYVRDEVFGKKDRLSIGVRFSNQPTRQVVYPQSVRPLLRPLASLTPEEATTCFHVGYPYWDKLEGVRVMFTDTSIELCSGPIKLIITEQGLIDSERENESKASVARLHVTALLTYLDQLLIDTRGYIQAKLAIDLTTIPCQTEAIQILRNYTFPAGL